MATTFRGSFTCPRVFGLFQKRIEGDDALLELAALRFREAGLRPEFYAETPMELDLLLRYEPMHEKHVVVHLGRDISPLEEGGRSLIEDFALRFGEHIFGLVIHDQVEIASCHDDYIIALRKMESRLEEIGADPYVFIEYASGLEPEIYLNLFEVIQDLRHVSACVDVGHIGLWQTRRDYALTHPGKDVCEIGPQDPRLPEMVEDIQSSVRSAVGTVLRVIRALGRLGKPLHFHLHDGHPLSTFSPFGVSDHLSFIEEIPIPFDYLGKGYLYTMFGPGGLSKIVAESLQVLGPDALSFSLEIHPREGRLPLGDVFYLFGHWKDKTNAERMNYWLSVLLRNHKLVLEACAMASSPDDRVLVYQQ